MKDTNPIAARTKSMAAASVKPTYSGHIIAKTTLPHVVLPRRHKDQKVAKRVAEAKVAHGP
jgi:hypothetical protein